MSKWKSETTELESKAQLKSHRKDKWKGLLLQNDLDLEMYPWWSDEEKIFERTLFAEADKNYEERKVKLKQELKKLSKENKTKYFQEIGEIEQDEDIWLKPSLLI